MLISHLYSAIHLTVVFSLIVCRYLLHFIYNDSGQYTPRSSVFGHENSYEPKRIATILCYLLSPKLVLVKVNKDLALIIDVQLYVSRAGLPSMFCICT